jgi:hypothetical protein
MNRQNVFWVLAVLLVLLLPGCEQVNQEAGKAFVITFDTGASLVTSGTNPTIDSSIVIYAGDVLDELPAPAWRDNTYTFRGWYDSPEDGTKVEPPFKPAADTRLYAYWGNGSTENDDYHITFNANGGVFPDSSSTLVKYIRRPPWRIIDLPIPHKTGGEIFGGWTIQSGGGTQLTAATDVRDLESSQRNVETSWLASGSSFNVTFKTYGGTWAEGGTADKTVSVTASDGVITIGDSMPALPTLAGFANTGWFYSIGTVTLPFNENIFINGNFTIFPVWDIGPGFTPPESVVFAVNEAGNAITGTDSNGVVYSAAITDGTNFITAGTSEGYKAAQFTTNDTSRVNIHRMAGKYLPLENWTMEIYFCLSSIKSNRKLVSFYTDAGSGQAGSFWIEDSGSTSRLLFRAFPRSTEELSAGNIVTADTWLHVAWVREGGKFTCYKNGEPVVSNAIGSIFNNAAFQNINTCVFGNVPNSKLYQFIMRNSAPALDQNGKLANKSEIMTVVNGLNGS